MTVRILNGDCRDVLATLPADSVHCVVTSPPYWGLRDYGVAGQIGLEVSIDAWVAEMVAVFREVRRVLRNDGTLWLNLGDSYAANRAYQVPDSKRVDVGNNTGSRVPSGLKPKDLIGQPWRVAFALQADGWWLRQDIIWHKPNPMPESIKDRCTKAHEYVFLLSKSERYHFDAAAISEATDGRVPGNVNPPKGQQAYEDGDERRRTKAGLAAYAQRSKRDDFARKTGKGETLVPGQSETQHRADREECDYDIDRRNKRSVWTVSAEPFKDAHFATFPPALIEPCILAGCPRGGLVLDPFGGAGTTGLVADRLQRNAILIELNPVYAEMARRRIHGDAPLFAEVSA